MKRSHQVSGVYGRSIRWTTTDGREMKKLGDQSVEASLELVNQSIVEFYGSTAIVKEVTNGATSSVSDTLGPQGILCSESPIQLPLQYHIWLEMRTSERERIERLKYSGKTISDLIHQIHQDSNFK